MSSHVGKYTANANTFTAYMTASITGKGPDGSSEDLNSQLLEGFQLAATWRKRLEFMYHRAFLACMLVDPR